MQKIVSALLLSLTLSSCITAQTTKGSMLPSDIIAKKQQLLGKTGTVSGYIYCLDNYCTIYEKLDSGGIQEGANIATKIELLLEKNKKILLTKCTSPDSNCSVDITGKFFSMRGDDISIKASSININSTVGLADVRKILNFL